MMPELFRIPGLGLPIYGYGAMLVIGLLVAIYVAGRLARRVGLDPETFTNMGILALVSGVIGARINHVLQNWSTYTSPDRSAWENFVAAINISSGGLTYYGGFIGGFAVVLTWAIWKKLPIRLSMDIVAPAIVIGLGFGRIGCLLNGCCWGQVCELPWAITYPYGSAVYEQDVDEGAITPPRELIVPADPKDPSAGLRLMPESRAYADPQLASLAHESRSIGRHPTQIYSTLAAFAIAGVCIAYFTLPRAPGQSFAAMLMMEGSSRFTIETLRVDPIIWGSMSYSMIIAAILVLVGIAMWIGFQLLGPHEKSAPLPRTT